MEWDEKQQLAKGKDIGVNEEEEIRGEGGVLEGWTGEQRARLFSERAPIRILPA